MAKEKSKEPKTTLVVRGLAPGYRTAFKTLAIMLDLSNADLLTRLMVQSRDPKVHEVIRRDRPRAARSAPARPAAAAAGR